MVKTASSELIEQVAFLYPDLGRPCELTPIHHEFRVSNSSFLYRTNSGRFLLKSMAAPEALYGHSDVAERLEWVGKAVLELRAGGLSVEEIIPSRGGRVVHRYRDHLLRLYVFDSGRPFIDRKFDVLRGARSLRRLHRDGLSCLSEATRQAVASLETAYPLRVTAGKVQDLQTFVQERAGTSPVMSDILAEWNLIQWAVDRALAYRPFTVEAGCVVHTDFHPRNALFSDDEDEAIMVDFDNMKIGSRLNCLSFSILRFAFVADERTPEYFQDALRSFTVQDCEDPAFMVDLAHAMLTLEIEKVLRILHRVMTTGHYAGFIENISPVHLANLKFLRASFNFE